MYFHFFKEFIFNYETQLNSFLNHPINKKEYKKEIMKKDPIQEALKGKLLIFK